MKKVFLAAMVLAMVLAFMPLACAQTFSSYSVTHSYGFSGVNGLPSVAQFNYSERARAFEPIPGLDSSNGIGSVVIVGPGGFGSHVHAGTDRPAPGFVAAGATAGVSATVNNWGGGSWGASMTSYGSAHAQMRQSWADASSSLSTQIWAPWGWRSGRIVWRPVIQDRVAGSARARGRDPIHVRGLDADGNPLWVESFFDVNLELNSDLDWTDTGMVVSNLAGEIDMSLDMGIDSLFVNSPGNLKLDILDGWVTQSNSTGRFAAVGLPSVGTFVGSTLSLPGLTNEFTLDYDLSSLAQPAQMEFLLDGGGSAATPEPASMTVLGAGVLGLLLKRRRKA